MKKELSYKLNNLNSAQMRLHKVYTLSPSAIHHEMDLMETLDLGSTESRSLVFDRELSNPDNELAVPADFAYLTQEIDWVKSKSKTLYDNLEIDLTDVTSSVIKKPEDKMFEDIRIIKGGLLEELNYPIERAASNTGKVDQQSTFVNAIANVGLRAFIEQCNLGLKFNKVKADLTVALPPEDTQSTARIQKFKNRLQGEYVFKLPRLNFTCTIEVKKEKIYFEDESKAAMRYWAATTDLDVEQYRNVLVIDGGGRSFDIAFLKNGILVTSGSKTLTFGGKKMEQFAFQHFVQNGDRSAPNMEMVRESFQTGQIQDGNAMLSMVESIHYSKNEISKMVMAGLNELFDFNDVRPNQINLILTAGGCFRESGEGEFVVPSLTDYIEARYQKVSPNTLFYQIEEDYPILLGLALFRLSQEG